MGLSGSLLPPRLVEEVAGGAGVDAGLGADLKAVAVRVEDGPGGVAVRLRVEAELLQLFLRVLEIEVRYREGVVVYDGPVGPADDVDLVVRLITEGDGAFEAVVEGDSGAEEVDVEVAAAGVIGHAVGDVVDGRCLEDAATVGGLAGGDLAFVRGAAGGSAGEDAVLGADLDAVAVWVFYGPAEVAIVLGVKAVLLHGRLGFGGVDVGDRVG